MTSRNELQQAVFQAVYRSRQQRARRALAIIMLGLKHGLRGLLFIWPAYLAVLGALSLQGGGRLAFLAILIPGLGVALHVLIKGVRADYADRVEGKVLPKTFVRRLFGK